MKKFYDTIELSDEIYVKEAESMMRLKHKNIVRFFGYCADTQWKMLKHDGRHVIAEARQRLLCFEFVPNGSLYDYISGTTVLKVTFSIFIFSLSGPSISLV